MLYNSLYVDLDIVEWWSIRPSVLVCTSRLLLQGRVQIILILHSITVHLCTVLKNCFTQLMSTLALAKALVDHSKQFGRYAMASLCRTSVLLLTRYGRVAINSPNGVSVNEWLVTSRAGFTYNNNNNNNKALLPYSTYIIWWIGMYYDWTW